MKIIPYTFAAAAVTTIALSAGPGAAAWASQPPTVGGLATTSPSPTTSPSGPASPAPAASPSGSADPSGPASPAPAASPSGPASPAPAADPSGSASPTPAASPSGAASPAPAASQPATPAKPAPALQPPGCAYFPVSAQCLAPLLGSLPACSTHLWVNNGKGWSCVPAAPSNAPFCDPPLLFPMLVDGSWECLGGPGPAVLPAPHTMPMRPAQKPATPDVVVAHQT